MFFPQFDCSKLTNKFLHLISLTILDSMHSIGKSDIFSRSKDDLKYVFIIFKTENESLSLTFKDGRIQIILKIISMLGNDVINVLCNAINDFLFSTEIFSIILLNYTNTSPKSLS